MEIPRYVEIVGAVFAFLTAMIGYQIHRSLFWAVIDYFFYPLAWAKWLVCREVSIAVIRKTFGFFTK